MPASALLIGVRIASLNLCTDELLLALAAPEQIVSVTHLAQQPQETMLWRGAGRAPTKKRTQGLVVARRAALSEE